MIHVIHQYITGEIDTDKAIEMLVSEPLGQLTPEQRVQVAEAFIAAHEERGGRPLDEAQLEHLADFILADDLRAKVKPKREYPFKSKERIARIEREGRTESRGSFEGFSADGVEHYRH